MIATGKSILTSKCAWQVGSVNNTFGVPGVEENCFFLKDLAQAKLLRKRINDSFEVACLPGTSPEERKRLLTFVVVGPVVAVSCLTVSACLILLYTHGLSVWLC